MTTATQHSVATQVHRIYIQASPQAVWDAITTPEWSQRYGYRSPVSYDLRPGGRFQALATPEMADRGAPPVVVEGEVLESDPPRRLVQTWRMLFEPAMASEPLTRVTWEIEEEFGACRLTVSHELEGAPVHAALVNGDVPNAGGGWPMVLSDLKTVLERAPADGDALEKVYEIYIKTTPERLWEAITSNEMRQRYSFGVGVVTDWTPGSRYQGVHASAGGPLNEGENLEVDPPRRLVQTYTALWSDEVKAEGASRVTWEIEPVGDSCRLLVTHDRLRAGVNPQIYGGWPQILSGLKTLLETGEDLTTPGSLMYAR